MRTTTPFFSQILRYWKIAYALCFAGYVVWMAYISSNEFTTINNQYRRITNKFTPNSITSSAIKELTKRCIKKTTSSESPENVDCSHWSPSEIMKQETIIRKNLVTAKKRANIKRITFYTSFILFFIIGPPLLLYLLIVGVIRIKRSITIVK